MTNTKRPFSFLAGSLLMFAAVSPSAFAQEADRSQSPILDATFKGQIATTRQNSKIKPSRSVFMEHSEPTR